METIQMDGVCKYCGQVMIVSVPEGRHYSQEEIDRMATMDCTCPGGEAEAVIQKRVNDAAEAIDRVLAKKNKKTVAQIMLGAVDALARDRVKKISVNIDGGTTCSMYLKNKKIIVEARTTEVECSDGEPEE